MTQRSETDADAADRAAIRAVIEADPAAYLSRDLDAWAKNFVQDERMTSISAMGRGILKLRGYESFAATYKKAISAAPPGPRDSFEHRNMQITVMGDMAWAVFDQVADVEDDAAGPTSLHYEVRVLERHEGQWRIALHSFFEPYRSAVSGPLIEVEDDARIIWMNTEAEAALVSSPLLVSAKGVLRAEQQDWTRTLHATIRKAAGLRHYYDYNRQYRARDTRAALPVVLGEDAEGGAQICMITVVDFKIYVSFGDTEALGRKLHLAAIVFGLSQTQVQLAEELCGGRSMPAAAAAMGVTTSTARTHLSRIYDKTGVRNQAALVRVLLSVGS